jgi:hypothetical protein
MVTDIIVGTFALYGTWSLYHVATALFDTQRMGEGCEVGTILSILVDNGTYAQVGRLLNVEDLPYIATEAIIVNVVDVGMAVEDGDMSKEAYIEFIRIVKENTGNIDLTGITFIDIVKG